MRIRIPYSGKTIIIIFISVILMLNSCEEFFDPDQGLIVDENEYFQDWNEYRAAELGLYALQQDLVEQLVILGELRGDLLTVTENADRDLVEVNRNQITAANKYASPLAFYRLIGACNRLSTRLEQDHPEVLKDTTGTIFDRLYGEVLCMRAWAYFNAARIYREVPYVWPELTTAEEISEYVSQNRTVINPVTIIYGPDGYNNDTIYNDTVVLERMYLDLPAIVDTFTTQLQEKVKLVGVLHNLVNRDPTWDVTIWNRFAMHSLLGQMYLEIGNFGKAIQNFDQVLRFGDYNEIEGPYIRYGLDNKFSFNKWQNIFTTIDVDEHILALWFSKSYEQQNQLQYLFDKETPNQYMLKPTETAITAWETEWSGYLRIENDDNYSLTRLDPEEQGIPGDFYRGYNKSYIYLKNGEAMTGTEVRQMLEYKRVQNESAVREMMKGVDTVVYKYTLGKNRFDRDANFPVFRAAGIHLYYAEIYSQWRFPDPSGIVKPVVSTSLAVLNDGTYTFDGDQMGVRGRVGLGNGIEAVSTNDPIYIHDPETNQVTGYLNYAGNLSAKQLYVEDQIMEERIREMAFEGERFYDLMRIARRRGDPAYLANKVAAKFESPLKEEIRQRLINEDNWYIKLQ